MGEQENILSTESSERDDALLHFMIHRPPTSGMCVFADGQVEVLSDYEMDYQDGEIITREVPLQWRPYARLSPEQLRDLVAQIRESDYFDLPEQMEPEGLEHDAMVVSWLVRLDEREHQVTTVGHDPTHHPTLNALRLSLEEMSADALYFDEEE